MVCLVSVYISNVIKNNTLLPGKRIRKIKSGNGVVYERREAEGERVRGNERKRKKQ